MYTPINKTVYLAAYSAALAAMNMSTRVFVPSVKADYYTNLAAVAGAFAQQFDIVWASTGNTELDSNLLNSAAEALWELVPAPSEPATAFLPSAYNQICQSLKLMMTTASAYWAGQGIIPPNSNANSSGIYNVLNYGAHADSGITDLGIPLQKAINAALAAGGGTILLPMDPAFPLGFYDLQTTIFFDYDNLQVSFGANLLFVGAAAAAPIRLSSRLGIVAAIQVNNSNNNTTFQRMSFFGQDQTSGNNISSCILGEGGFRATITITDCEFGGIIPAVGVITGNGPNMVLNNPRFMGCGSQNPVTSSLVRILNADNGGEYNSVHAVDLGNIGVHGFGGEVSQSVIRIDNLSNPPFQSGATPIVIQDFCSDEENVQSIIIGGTNPASRIAWVQIVGGNIFSNNSTTGGCAITARHVDRLEITDVAIGGQATNTLPAQAISLIDCKDVYLSGILTRDAGFNSDGATMNQLSADALCKSLVIEDCVFALIDSQAAVTQLIQDGIATTVYQPTAGIFAEKEIVQAINAVAPAGGTGTIHQYIEPRTTKQFSGNVFGNSDTGAFARNSQATFTNVAAQATLATPVAAGVNPALNPPGDVSDAAFGASSINWTAGAAALSDSAILTATNQGALANDFMVRLKQITQWRKFDPSLFTLLFGSNEVIGYWDHTTIVNAAGAVHLWKDRSGNHNDLIGVGGTAPAFAAAAGPNLLPAARFNGTGQFLKAPLAAGFLKSGTILTVGGFTAPNQVHVALSDAPNVYPANGVALRTITESGDFDVMYRNAAGPPGATLLSVNNGSYRARIGSFWIEGANISVDNVNGITMHGAGGVVTPSNVTLGALPDGTLSLSGDIQAVILLKRPLMSTEMTEGGLLRARFAAWAKALYGTP